ncbi:mono/diheme cytochrome c family protein [Novosphingobium sp. SG751A]|uniref:c-type cytochrome n=1 Tax=Novosphingobium sp. SG751A TaxID=2587000 RepID=UPI003530105D|nr:mono/diheme cytochrome c family protein [Novosphingobium sp. SG751A]
MRRWALLPLMLVAAPASAQTGQALGQTLAQRSPAKTYASICAYCHGHNVGPIILGRKLPVEYIQAMVRAGRNGMPAMRPTEISPAELDALATWISKAPKDIKEHGQ